MPSPTERPVPFRQSIAWRLALGHGTVLVVIGLVSVTCLSAIFDIHERLHAIKRDEERARSVVRLSRAIQEQYAHVAHTIIIGDDSHADLFHEATRQLDALAAAVRADGGPPVAPAVDRIVTASTEIGRLFETSVLPAVRAGSRAGLAATHGRILQIAQQAQGDAEALGRQAEASMDDLKSHVRTTQHGAILLTIIAQIVALMTAMVVGLYLYRTIARPIAALSTAASRVRDGNLETAIPIDRDDELGRLSRRFNEMVAAMKVHQKELLQTDRVVALASMSAAIAHEINNPIAVILGYAKLLRRGGAESDPKALAAIEEEAERCQHVIEGLLDLTRGAPLHWADVDLRSVADNVISRHRSSGAAPEVAIEIHGHASAQGDESKLRQVLMNLVANAIDACGTTGTVVLLIADPTPNIVTIEIVDTGPGIAAEVRDRIFEPFFTTKATGSGLGLAISRAIARAHGGDLIVASTTNRGTTFRVTLPKQGGSPS